MKKTLAFTVALLVSPLSLGNSGEPLKILDFLMDEVELCDSDFECSDVNISELPDPTKTPIPVTGFNQSNGMLEFTSNEKSLWIHQTEVELNQKAVASVVCTDQKISRKSDKEVFATYGLGEGC